MASENVRRGKNRGIIGHVKALHGESRFLQHVLDRDVIDDSEAGSQNVVTVDHAVHRPFQRRHIEVAAHGELRAQVVQDGAGHKLLDGPEPLLESRSRIDRHQLARSTISSAGSTPAQLPSSAGCR